MQTQPVLRGSELLKLLPFPLRRSRLQRNDGGRHEGGWKRGWISLEKRKEVFRQKNLILFTWSLPAQQRSWWCSGGWSYSYVLIIFREAAKLSIWWTWIYQMGIYLALWQKLKKAGLHQMLLHIQQYLSFTPTAAACAFLLPLPFLSSFFSVEYILSISLSFLSESMSAQYLSLRQSKGS